MPLGERATAEYRRFPRGAIVDQHADLSFGLGLVIGARDTAAQDAVLGEA